MIVITTNGKNRKEFNKVQAASFIYSSLIDSPSERKNVLDVFFNEDTPLGWFYFIDDEGNMITVFF